jgi:hypothetical protein
MGPPPRPHATIPAGAVGVRLECLRARSLPHPGSRLLFAEHSADRSDDVFRCCWVSVSKRCRVQLLLGTFSGSWSLNASDRRCPCAEHQQDVRGRHRPRRCRPRTWPPAEACSSVGSVPRHATPGEPVPTGSHRSKPSAGLSVPHSGRVAMKLSSCNRHRVNPVPSDNTAPARRAIPLPSITRTRRGVPVEWEGCVCPPGGTNPSQRAPLDRKCTLKSPDIGSLRAPRRPFRRFKSSLGPRRFSHPANLPAGCS